MAKIIEEINLKIKDSSNFLVSGGAGSGKTYTLVEVLKEIYFLNPSEKVACITFTNVAVDEIKERAPFENLYVSTIHEFLWTTISNFQKQIKESIAELIADEEISYSGDRTISKEYFEDLDIKYREWKKIEDGVISHDEVIKISAYLFKKYPLLSSITKDRFSYILIDEYQDTFEEVVEILLDFLSNSDKKIVLGFFGDSMQSIYNQGVGNINKYVERGDVEEIKKEDNRRNPQVIIDLINKVRNDGLIQEHANDESATNYGIQGSIKFLYKNSEDYNIEEIKKTEAFKEFNFSDNHGTKELYLVHSLIADKAGFPNLYDIYTKDRLIEHSYRIKKYVIEHEVEIKEDQSFGDVIDMELVSMRPTVSSFIEENEELYNEARSYSYREISKIYFDRDQLMGQKTSSSDDSRGLLEDPISEQCRNISEAIFYYQNSKYNQFIRKNNFRIRKASDKQILKDSIETIINDELSVEEVIQLADEKNIWVMNDKLKKFINEKAYVYNRVKKVKFNEYFSLYKFIEEYSPYSTQHGIKGAEFDSVFVVLDNGKWNMYNFNYLFTGKGNPNVIERTRKLFYVCCSRAKKRLVVFFHNPDEDTLSKAEEWFGSENMICLDT